LKNIRVDLTKQVIGNVRKADVCVTSQNFNSGRAIYY